MIITKQQQTSLTFSSRASRCVNPTARELFLIMEEKQSNLSVAVDVATQEELLDYAETLGPSICLFKTHIDIISDFDEELPHKLEKIAKKHRFLIFEDRKFADIGNTVKEQYGGGLYKIAGWADIVNAHTVPGPGIIEGLREVGLQMGRGLLLLAEMSSAETLATGAYTEATVAMAQRYSDFVIGFISQRKLVDDPCFIHMTPGVNLSTNGDTLGQQYNTPQHVITEMGGDVIIVGRGILAAADPILAAKEYREAGWSAHLQRLGSVN